LKSKPLPPPQPLPPPLVLLIENELHFAVIRRKTQTLRKINDHEFVFDEPVFSCCGNIFTIIGSSAASDIGNIFVVIITRVLFTISSSASHNGSRCYSRTKIPPK